MSKTVIILFLNYFLCAESNRRQYTKRAYSITGRQTQLWDNSQRVPEAGPSGKNWSGQKIVWGGGTEVSFLVFWKCWNSCNCCYLDPCFVAVICQYLVYSDTCRKLSSSVYFSYWTGLRLLNHWETILPALPFSPCFQNSCCCLTEVTVCGTYTGKIIYMHLKKCCKTLFKVQHLWKHTLNHLHKVCLKGAFTMSFYS